ncbi:MAG TPA: hypothetical protein VFI25_03945 [Planctomycetota bacterium]|jgi:hypothetical protein|nr:hypothetical protein [Planctomycetota bacterium]
MRILLLTARGTTVLFLAGAALGQPCPAPLTVTSYQVMPVAPAFVDVASLAGTVVLWDAAAAIFDDEIESSTANPAVANPFPAGFAFSYFGAAKTQFTVSPNGYLVFSGLLASGSATVAGNQSRSTRNGHLGNPAVTPNDLVAVFWDDHIGTTVCVPAANVMWRYDAAAMTLTIEWKNMDLKGGSFAGQGGCYSFEAILFDSTHPARPNEIEFQYDPASLPPPPSSPCLPASGAISTSYYGISGTIGLEGSGTTGTVGVDATERGAGNTGFPSYGVRFLPKTISAPNFQSVGSYTVTDLASDPFMHIEGLPGTVELIATVGGPWCRGGTTCFDDDNSARNLGGLTALPWKFNMYGRVAKAFNVSTNGYLGLGQGQFHDFVGNPLAVGTDEPNLIIAPRHEDWQGLAPPSDICGWTGSTILYRVDGLPGARVATFEWHDGHLYCCTPCATGPEHCSFQARIYEASAGAVTVTPGCPAGLSPSVAAGNRNDLIEFLWDASANCTQLTGNSVIENWNALQTHAATFNPGGGTLFDPCDEGTIRYYGDANVSAVPPGACIPEIRGNNVAPMAGAADFGLSLVNATPGAIALLLLDGTTIPGLRTPVPPGGIPLGPLGTLWVGFPPPILLLAGATSLGPACSGSLHVPIPIPANPSLIGASVFAEFASLVPGPLGLAVELTEGAKVTIGP